jgi:DNA-binding response OmpR family regulator
LEKVGLILKVRKKLMIKILLIDDDEKLADLLKNYLSSFDIRLTSALTPDDGLKLLEKDSFDIVLLDVMLPEKDGFEVCRIIRKTSDIPVIMLTARGELTDRVVGLEIGADDYVAKPFEPRELVARIRRLHERSHQAPNDKGILRFGALEVDIDRRLASLNGETLDLTSMEFQLLQLLCSNPGKNFSRDEIQNFLRGIDSNFFSRSIDIMISRLRHKLHDVSKNPVFIKTVWGTGYAFIGKREEKRAAEN